MADHFIPDPSKLYTARLMDGWHVMDKHGPLAGPYWTLSDANAVIANARSGGDMLKRHISYGAA